MMVLSYWQNKWYYWEIQIYPMRCAIPYALSEKYTIKQAHTRTYIYTLKQLHTKDAHDKSSIYHVYHIVMFK